jgi:hypothetical protein
MKTIAAMPHIARGTPTVVSPLFTIAIPTYRRPDGLRRALMAALAQETEVSYEVIVVDNGDEMDTKRVMKEFKSPRLGWFVNSSNLGMVGNWNQCLALARGDFMTILHDDDTISPFLLDRALKAMQLTGCDVFACRTISGPKAPVSWERAAGLEIRDATKLMLHNLSPFPGVVFKSADAIAIGGFDVDSHPCSDLDFWIRLIGDRSYCLDHCLSAFYCCDENQESAVAWEQIVSMSAKVRTRAGVGWGFGATISRLFATWSSWTLKAGYRNMYSQSSRSFFDGPLQRINIKALALAWRCAHVMRRLTKEGVRN